jgi:hypothetical protein
MALKFATMSTAGAFADRLTIDHDGDVYSTAWTDYFSSSTIVGWSSFVSGRAQIMYRTLGDMVWVAFSLEGTSNATTITFTVPYTSYNLGSDFAFCSALGFTYNNSTYMTPGRTRLPSNSAVVTVSMGAATGGWTASGAKQITGQFWYMKA